MQVLLNFLASMKECEVCSGSGTCLECKGKGFFLKKLSDRACNLAKQVVPTEYTDVKEHTIQSNQFSLTEKFQKMEARQMQSLPGISIWEWSGFALDKEDEASQW